LWAGENRDFGFKIKACYFKNEIPMYIDIIDLRTNTLAYKYDIIMFSSQMPSLSLFDIPMNCKCKEKNKNLKNKDILKNILPHLKIRD
jgi:hypothetical protein